MQPTQHHFDQGKAHDLLTKGLAELAIYCSAEQQTQLVSYVELLSKWNHTYNLTAVRDPLEMISLHLLDSLSILPYLNKDRIVDVGAGAGLPGIPLAILSPDRQFVEVESNNKKTRFMAQVVMELELKNIQVESLRSEKFHPQQAFDTVISRAFASISDMLHFAGHLCRPGGMILAMKGKNPEQELTDLPEGFQCLSIHKLQVPGVDAERHLVHISPLAN